RSRVGLHNVRIVKNSLQITTRSCAKRHSGCEASFRIDARSADAALDADRADRAADQGKPPRANEPGGAGSGRGHIRSFLPGLPLYRPRRPGLLEYRAFFLDLPEGDGPSPRRPQSVGGVRYSSAKPRTAIGRLTAVCIEVESKRMPPPNYAQLGWDEIETL